MVLESFEIQGYQITLSKGVIPNINRKCIKASIHKIENDDKGNYLQYVATFYGDIPFFVRGLAIQYLQSEGLISTED